jgi:cobalt/nickel transport system ATP-binding protein
VTEALLRLTDVHVDLADGRSVLAGVDLTLNAGDRLAVRGANGAGKTTLLRTIVGLERVRSGSIWAFGRERRRPADFREVRLRAGLVFQNADDQLFCPTVREDVAFGPRNQGLSATAADARAEETLLALGLAGYGDRVTHRLSGGEARRVALATVLAMRPDVLLLDEPLTGLDEESEARLIDVLAGLPQALVVVSHEARLERALGATPWRLAEGRLRPVAENGLPPMG